MPRGEIPEQKTDAYISGVWYTIARNQMKYNRTGKQITFENLAGQLTKTAWDCLSGSLLWHEYEGYDIKGSDPSV